MSNINRITGAPGAIVIKSNVGGMNAFRPPSLIDIPSDTTIVGQRGNEFPGTVLPSESHIRLVELSCEHIGRTRTVSLRYYSVRLSTAPKFSALSYTWGPASRTNSIRGVYFTDNLLSALVNIASTCEPHLFWIDALCINQEDFDEKPAQIRMMRQIYGKAKEVFVWLGNPDTVSVELMQKICKPKAALLLAAPGMEYTDEELIRLGLPEFGDPAWSSLMRFLQRPYFRRVWVLQELLMARSTTVACGRYRFPWQLIQHAANWLHEKDLMPILLSQTFSTSQSKTAPPSADLINITLTLEDRRHSLYLEELLGASRYLLATDPRDKIIGLLGLVTPDDPVKDEIYIDYQQPIADFYRAVTGAIINTHRSLKLLSLVTDKATSKVLGLPSWVPDYSINIDKTSYRWAHFTTPGRRIAVEWQPDTNELHVQGRITDEVVFVAQETASPGTDAEDTLLAWFHAAASHKGADEWDWILSLAATTDTDVNSDAEAFWRAMLLDGVDAISPAPASYREHFAALVFTTFLQSKTDDTNFFLGLANAVLYCISSLPDFDPTAPRDGLLATLIKIAVTARNDGLEFVIPGYSFPAAWIVRDEDGTYTLGPQGDTIQFLAMMARWGGSRFFVTRGGRMGRGPMQIRGGERVLLVEGCEQIFMVRKVDGGDGDWDRDGDGDGDGDGDRVTLVGECYVHALIKEGEIEGAKGFGKVVIV